MSCHPWGKYGFNELDPTQPYDFEEFNAYEYAGARSLNQALLMASKEQVERTSLLPTLASDMAHITANNGLGGGEIQTHQSSGNVAVAVDPKVLPKTEEALTCPICGDTLRPNGKGRGKYTGMKQFACRSQDHTSQMGGKAYYQSR